ncbi:tetratricopeptide repeat protein [Candidatus Latescibacterota bacterium]
MGNKNNIKEIKSRYIVIISRIYPILIICILGIILYSNSFDCSFQLDDFQNIIGNQTIHDIHNIKAIWDFNNLRFVGYLTLAFNYHYHQLDVFGYHAVNVIIHIITSLMVWWLVELILSSPVMRTWSMSKHKRLLAFGCSLLFVSHPIQTQAVTYIVQRFASLASLFYITSLCLYMKARQTEKKHIKPIYFTVSAVAAVLGMFTKETVFTLPFAILLFEFAFFRKGEIGTIIRNKKILLLLIPLLLFALIIPGWILFKYGPGIIFKTVYSDRSQDAGLTNIVYLMTQFKVMVIYLRLLFLPIWQNIDHDIPASLSFFEFRTFTSFIFLVSVFVAAISLFRRRRFVAVGILWFFLTLSVESSFIPLHNVMFEHRLYLPMVGFSMFFVGIFYHVLWKKHARIALSLFLALICCYSFMTYQRNKVWKDEISFWSDAVKKSPQKSRAYHNLADAYLTKEMYEDAYQQLSKALRFDPNQPALNFNMGYCLHKMGRIEEALKHYNIVLKYPGVPLVYTHNNMGEAYFDLGRYNEALDHFSNSMSIDPSNVSILRSMASRLVQENKLDEAVSYYLAIQKFFPEDFDVHKNIGILKCKQQHYDDALKYLSKASQIKPDDPEIITFLEEAQSKLNIIE